jgi:hypothetical protein
VEKKALSIGRVQIRKNTKIFCVIFYYTVIIYGFEW